MLQNAITFLSLTAISLQITPRTFISPCSRTSNKEISQNHPPQTSKQTAIEFNHLPKSFNSPPRTISSTNFHPSRIKGSEKTPETPLTVNKSENQQANPPVSSSKIFYPPRREATEIYKKKDPRRNYIGGWRGAFTSATNTVLADFRAVGLGEDGIRSPGDDLRRLRPHHSRQVRNAGGDRKSVV